MSSIRFGFVSRYLKKWYEFSEPITERSEAKATQVRVWLTGYNALSESIFSME